MCAADQTEGSGRKAIASVTLEEAAAVRADSIEKFVQVSQPVRQSAATRSPLVVLSGIAVGYRALH